MSYAYDHKKTEQIWKERWSAISLYSADEVSSKPKKYILEAFPYPSGTGLHVGHTEGYTGGDISSRFYRMNDYKVLHPMGWDAFGLPAENYAIKTGVHPRPNTDQAIATFTDQMKNVGFGLDWDRELATHRADYYKWSQWIFGLLYKKGLAYKKEALVNWDPVDKTVLANEQVLADGTAERSGALVEQKHLSQWFFKITDYADRLLEDLDKVQWPESTKQMQRNWIGKSEGASVHWDLASPNYPEFYYSKDVTKENLDYERSRGSAFIRIKETGEYVVFSKNKSGYVLPGGEPEIGENQYQAAIRETLEEVGIQNLSYVSAVGQCKVYDTYEDKHGCTLDKAYLFEISQAEFNNRVKGEVDKLKFNVETVALDLLKNNTIDHIRWQIDQLDQPNLFEIETFTTRLDTIFGATYLVLAPEHHLVTRITQPDRLAEVTDYQEQTKRKSQLQRTDLNKDKSGVFTGSYAIHPFTGEQVPIFVADYVLSTYGTGAIMAVPAHDQRDFECAHIFNEQIQKNLKSEFSYRKGDSEIGRRVQSVLFDPQTGLYGVQKDSFRILSNSIDTGSHIEEAFDQLNDSLCGEEIYQVFELGTEIKAGLPKELNNFNTIYPRLVTVSGQVAEDVMWLQYEEILDTITESPTYRDNKAATTEVLKRACAKAVQLSLDQQHHIHDTNVILPLEIPEIIAPVFEESVKQGAPTVERDTVRVFVRSAQSGKWLVCSLKNMDNLKTIIVGGVEEGEDLVAAAQRELAEEAGITKSTVIDILDIPVRNIFYASAKDENRIAVARTVVLEVQTEEIVPEPGFEFSWIAAEDMKEYFDLEIDKYFWNRYAQPDHIYSEYGVLIDSHEYTNMKSKDAREQMADFLEAKGMGSMQTTFRLRDWLISRQRYWGAPIPIMYDGQGNQHLVADADLPVILPDDVEFKPSGRSPLIDHVDFHAGAKAALGNNAVRESDTMDTFMCSSWYFLRFCDPHNQQAFADTDKVNMWGPVDTYIIGAEHTVLHLLYARFFTKVLYDEGLINFDEPFMNLVHPGMILGEDTRKMSKRWGNVINPNDVVEEYGADTLRMYEMFMGPFTQSKPWNIQTIKGVRRFIDRVWNVQDLVQFDGVDNLEVELHRLIKKVTNDIPDFSFNTSVAEFMKFVKLIEKEGKIGLTQWRSFMLLLAPFAPCITEEMWSLSQGKQGHLSDFTADRSIHSQSWPYYDEEILEAQTVTIGIQVNGKRRAEIETSPDDTQESIKAKVLAMEAVSKWLDGEPSKFIYVPGKIVNIVA